MGSRFGAYALAAAPLVVALGVAGAAYADLPLIDGTPGADMLEVGDHAGYVRGGAGDDHLRGSPEADRLDGNAGKDTLVGGAGADTLHGGRDNDSLSGGAGDDLVAGDRGDDILSGGPGADRFVLTSEGAHDTITDFSAADGDKITVEPGATPKVEAVGDAVLVSLADGSDIRIKGATVAEVERSLELQPLPKPPPPPAAPAPAPAAPKHELPLLPILLVLLAAAGGAIAFVLKRRR